jgi:uncharacterized protein (TIGR00251 family)
MSIILEVKVIPQSGKQALQIDKSGQLKCYLKSPPEGGKANEELIKFMSKKLSITQDSFFILQGVTARKKLLKIDIDCTREELLGKLGVDYQKTI